MGSSATLALTRPIVGIENRTAQEVFDIMCDRFRRSPSLSGGEVKVVAWIATETPDGVPDVTLRPDTAEAWRADGFIVTPLVTLSSHQSALAVDDPGRNPPVTWKSRAEAAEARANAAVEALTPSAETKAAYIGEFHMGVTLSAGGEEEYRRVQIPWTSIKEIMAAIKDRATLNGAKP